jgi:hypothetical protein
MSCPEAHPGWQEGCVTATPTPETTEGVFGLVTGLSCGNECRPANGLLIRAGRWGMLVLAASALTHAKDAAVYLRRRGAPGNGCRPVGRSDEFAVLTHRGSGSSAAGHAVVISTQDDDMGAAPVAQVVLQPGRRTADVRQMPFGALPHGATARRSGPDDLRSRSGGFRVFAGCSRSGSSVSAADRPSRRSSSNRGCCSSRTRTVVLARLSLPYAVRGGIPMPSPAVAGPCSRARAMCSLSRALRRKFGGQPALSWEPRVQMLAAMGGALGSTLG